MSYGGSHMPRQIPIREYISNKIEMLVNEFFIRLDDDEIVHMRSLKTEKDVDRYAHEIIKRKL
jgi:hypothetical protein